MTSQRHTWSLYMFDFPPETHTCRVQRKKMLCFQLQATPLFYPFVCLL